ncbi:MAG: protein-(glutamine-N5) methyltransferase, release factor-specific, partial [Acidimicrobiaceae bacterium]|nr:protein-(glutamine-N5) methyltransferase, release factor-specific [Acidimicrobiaceae bacterium]
VVEIALAVLEAAAKERHGRPLLALDLGTGSGAIACALVSRCEVVEVVALDRSIEALALAKENRRSLPEAAGERIRLVESSWYAGLGDELAGSVDLLVSNPPYLAESEWAGLDPVVRDHDPYGALVAGPTGLEAIEEVVSGAPSVLVPHGSVVLELAPAQAADAESLALAAGAASADVLSDLAGRPRVLRARW